MGQLDSLTLMNLGPWVCEHGIGYLENYREGYTHHPGGNYNGKRLMPIPGKTYRVLKYAGSHPYIVEDVYDVIYNGPIYTDEELLRINHLWRTKGYYGNREFYQPDELDMSLSIPDFRNTLLWAPEVTTDDNGEATVSFYCSDINTGFTGRIEGVSVESGLLGVTNFDFRVIRPINK